MKLSEVNERTFPVTPESIERAKLAAQRERDDLNAYIFPRFGAYVDRQGRFFRDRLNIIIGESGRVTIGALMVVWLAVFLTWFLWLAITIPTPEFKHPRNWPIASPSR